jgi:hypothetical protein
MADTLIVNRLPGVATGPGAKLLTPQEIALIQSGTVVDFYAAHLAEPDADNNWPGAVANTDAHLVAATTLSGGVGMPTYQTVGGPDGQPFWQGRAANIDARLVTPAGKFPIDQDWTVGFVAKPGTNAIASVLFAIGGNNGRAVHVKLDMTNMVVQTFAAGSTGTNRISAAAAAGSWYYGSLSYNNASQKLDLRINGVDAGSATYDLIYLSDKYALFGGYDEVVNFASTTFREGGLAELILLRGDVDTNASLRALLDAAIDSRFPSLV